MTQRPTERLMRLRQNVLIRDMTATTEFNQRQLIQPLFAVESLSRSEEIPGLKGVFRQPIEDVLKQIEADLKANVSHFILFTVPGKKTETDFKMDFVASTVRKIKERFGKDIFLWTDHCLCSMTSNGHCGVFDAKGNIDLDITLQAIGKMALATASNGGDGISPSDMMDGRTSYIRKVLDENSYSQIPIMSYSTKFSSHFYGPFRHAADSAPTVGDRKTYQIDVRNFSDAMASSIRCADEGADLLMVKPGMTSIDLIKPILEKTGKPVGAYQVSGEYAAMVLLAEKKLIQFDQALLETWSVFKRAGAQFIITYGAREGQRLGVK